MIKPDCDCLNILLEKVKETNKIPPEDEMYFQDQNLFGGQMMSSILIEHKRTSKAGKVRKFTDHVNIMHSFCAFCGKAYRDKEMAELFDEANKTVKKSLGILIPIPEMAAEEITKIGLPKSAAKEYPVEEEQKSPVENRRETPETPFG